MILFPRMTQELAEDAMATSPGLSFESCIEHARGFYISSFTQLVVTPITFALGMALMDGWIVTLLSALPGIIYAWFSMVDSCKKTEVIKMVISLSVSSIPMYWLFMGAVYTGVLIFEFAEPILLNLVS